MCISHQFTILHQCFRLNVKTKIKVNNGFKNVQALNDLLRKKTDKISGNRQNSVCNLYRI